MFAQTILFPQCTHITLRDEHISVKIL